MHSKRALSGFEESRSTVLLAAMDSDVRLLEGEVLNLEERARRGDAPAYKSYKIRKRALRILQRELKELRKKDRKARASSSC
ncbi:MAG: hypothetical protein HY815_31770 [Candidatus Riflebacteria bacterium]|nr:hypothetical protein [Candidatus Riflebacteria bacterium]